MHIMRHKRALNLGRLILARRMRSFSTLISRSPMLLKAFAATVAHNSWQPRGRRGQRVIYRYAGLHVDGTLRLSTSEASCTPRHRDIARGSYISNVATLRFQQAFENWEMIGEKRVRAIPRYPNGRQFLQHFWRSIRMLFLSEFIYTYYNIIIILFSVKFETHIRDRERQWKFLIAHIYNHADI